MMTQSRIEMISHKEVDPTILRLVKIYWSQTWRALIIFVILGSFIFPFVFIFSNSINFESLDTSAGGGFYFILLLLPILYLWQCVLFRLVIGLSYTDFVLSFLPKMNYKTAGYWPAIFIVSWAYFWRTSIVMISFRFLEYLYPQFFDQTVIFWSSFFLEIGIGLLLLRFIVNKQYGKVRLSLLKPEIEA